VSGAERGSAAYFDGAAEDWDAMRQAFFGPGVRDRALATAALPVGGLAADVGAGGGFLTEALLAAGLRVVAVDRSERMLAALRRRLGDPDGLELRPGGAEALPLDDASVDGVLANMLLHHVDDPRAVLAEMARVLRPGGRLALTDLESHDHEWLRAEQHDRWLGFDAVELAGWMGAAGFEEVRVEPIGERCAARSGGGGQASVSILLASGRSP